MSHKRITDVRANEPPMTKQLEATLFFRKEAESMGIIGTGAALYAREKLQEWIASQCEIPAEMRTRKFSPGNPGAKKNHENSPRKDLE
jgi:hypothetical protein